MQEQNQSPVFDVLKSTDSPQFPPPPPPADDYDNDEEVWRATLYSGSPRSPPAGTDDTAGCTTARSTTAAHLHNLHNFYCMCNTAAHFAQFAQLLLHVHHSCTFCTICTNSSACCTRAPPCLKCTISWVYLSRQRWYVQSAICTFEPLKIAHSHNWTCAKRKTATHF